MVSKTKNVTELAFLLGRGCPKNLVESEMKKFKFPYVSNSKSQNRTLKMIPRVIIYYPFHCLVPLEKFGLKISISYTCRGAFRIQSNIYDGAFLRKQLTAMPLTIFAIKLHCRF